MPKVTPPPPPDFAPGSVFAGYTLEKLVARGPLGEAFVARSASGKMVIVRVFSRAVTADEAVSGPLEREAHGVGLVTSPHLPELERVTTEQGHLVIAFEHVTGRHLGECGRQEPRRAMGLARACALGLSALHQAGQCHGRLCPERIRLREDGTPVLVDFGLFRGSMDPAPKREQVPAVYRSPELLEQAPIDIRTDLHAVGVLLYQLLVGRPPFSATDPARSQAQILRDERPKVSAQRAGLHPEVDAVVARCCARRPAARYATPDELVRVLQTCPVDPPPAGAEVAKAQALAVGKRIIARWRDLVALAVLAVVMSMAPTAWRRYQLHDLGGGLAPLSDPACTWDTAQGLVPTVDRYAALAGEQAPEVQQWRGIIAELQQQVALAKASEERRRVAHERAEAAAAERRAAAQRQQTQEAQRQAEDQQAAEAAAVAERRRQAEAEGLRLAAERRDRARSDFILARIPTLLAKQADLEAPPTRRSVAALEAALTNVRDLEALQAAMAAERAKELADETAWLQLQAHRRTLEKHLATATARRAAWLASTPEQDPGRIKEIAAEEAERTRLSAVRQADRETWNVP